MMWRATTVRPYHGALEEGAAIGVKYTREVHAAQLGVPQVKLFVYRVQHPLREVDSRKPGLADDTRHVTGCHATQARLTT
jgi:hypothetical protein